MHAFIVVSYVVRIFFSSSSSRALLTMVFFSLVFPPHFWWCHSDESPQLSSIERVVEDAATFTFMAILSYLILAECSACVYDNIKMNELRKVSSIAQLMMGFGIEMNQPHEDIDLRKMQH